jgi:hypothetical protein
MPHFELESPLNRRDVAPCLKAQAVLNFIKASFLICRPSWLFWRCLDCFGNNPDLNRISLEQKIGTIDCATLEFYTTFSPAGHQAIQAGSPGHSHFDLVRQAGLLCSKREQPGEFSAPTGFDVIQRGKGRAGKYHAGTGRAGGNAEGQHKPD